MSILFKEYTDEEANALFYEDGREAGYDDGYTDGVAEQRAKYESVISAKDSELKAQAEEIQRLKTLLEEMKQH